MKTHTQNCQRCKYCWEYSGKKRPKKYPQFITCPKCFTKVKVIFENLKGGLENAKEKI